jgi:hypothetical protein
MSEEEDKKKKKKKKKKKRSIEMTTGQEDISIDPKALAAMEGPGVIESGETSVGTFAALRPDAYQGNIKQEAEALAKAEEEAGKEDFLGFKVSKDAKNALTYFLPQAIAGLGGAITGDTNTTLAAMNEAERINTAYRQDLMQQEKLRLQEKQIDQRMLPLPTASRFQQTGRELPGVGLEVFDKTTGQQGVMDPVTQQFRPLYPEELEQVKGTQSRFERRQQLTETKAGQLSDKQVEAISSADKLETQISQVKELSKRVNTGPISGRVQSAVQGLGVTAISRILGQDPEAFAQLKASSAGITLNATRMLQGARPSDLDLEFVQRMVPDENDDDDVFAAKLDLLTKFMTENKASLLENIKKGQRLKIGTLKRYFEKNAPDLLKNRKPSARIPNVNDSAKKRASGILNRINKIKSQRKK